MSRTSKARMGISTAIRATGSLGLALLLSSTATAQQADPVPEVVVTGSRIKSTIADNPNPISIISSKDIARTGATSVEDLLTKLPAADFTGGLSAGTNYFGGGASQIGLRNLGAQRTLVLVNGQRFVNTDYLFAPYDTVDFNNMPLAMIDRIEVLKDGASSIYGADAVGGVINVILKQHFNGVQVDSTLGGTDKGDRFTYSTSSTIGYDFGRGNIMLHVGADHRDPILQTSRSWATDQHVNTSNPLLNISYMPYGLVAYDGTPNVNLANADYYYNRAGAFHNAYDTAFFLQPGIKLPPSTLFQPNPGGVGYGFGPLLDYSQDTYLEGSLERKNVNLTAHFDVTDEISAVFEGFYTRRESEEQIPPDPIGVYNPTTNFPVGVFIPATLSDGSANPYNPYAPDTIYMQTRRIETGDRHFTDTINTYRFKAGLEGSLAGKYDWSAGYIYGASISQNLTAGVVNMRKAEQIAGGLPCSAADAAQGCSLGNWLGYDTLTPAQARYMTFTERDFSETKQTMFYSNISGPVVELPAGPLSAAVGLEQRTESLSQNPDPLDYSGDAENLATKSAGSYGVWSGYIEFKAPLLKDLDWAKALTANASMRYDNYSTFGDATTWRAGLDYAITDDVRLRTAHSTGVRAPQVKEVFGGGFLSATLDSDPCSNNGGPGGGPGAYYQSVQCTAQLAAAGIANTDLSNSGGFNLRAGGNRALQPEKSIETDIGGVFTPRLIPGFNFSVDYYTINISNAIGSQDPADILNACYAGAGNANNACSYIVRTPGSGIIQVMNTQLRNTGFEKTSGLEFAVGYGFGTEQFGFPELNGRIQLDGEAVYLLNDTRPSAGGTPYDYAGKFYNDNGEPRWKANISARYAQDNWSFGWATRYYGDVVNFNLSTCYNGCDNPLGNSAEGIFYHDISLTYAIDKLNLTLGMDNVFDQHPPYISGGYQLPTLAAAGYDFVGRFIYMKASYKFDAF